MNGYLLDTNIVLIALTRPSLLSKSARDAVLRGPNVLSVIAYWEVLLKVTKGILAVGHPRAWWLDALDQLAATALPLAPTHIDRLHDLPAIHRDPFDRVLIAQASVEGLTFVTTDREIRKYKSAQVRVLA